MQSGSETESEYEKVEKPDEIKKKQLAEEQQTVKTVVRYTPQYLGSLLNSTRKEQQRQTQPSQKRKETQEKRDSIVGQSSFFPPVTSEPGPVATPGSGVHGGSRMRRRQRGQRDNNY